MNKHFEELAAIVHDRRSIKPAKMNGKKIDDEDLLRVLELANWAPSHGLTEPWRFIVYAGDEVKAFCELHADLYKSVTPQEKFDLSAYEKHLHNGDLASHLAVAFMKRGHSPKVPAIEETAATAAAIQNVLLGAAAAGFAAFWSTAGMTHHPSFKALFNLGEQDLVMGLLYFGFSNEHRAGRRLTTIGEKITWHPGKNGPQNGRIPLVNNL